MKMMLSASMLNSAAIEAMFSDFGFQFTRERRDVRRSEHHLVPRLEHLGDVIGVVLAAHR